MIDFRLALAGLLVGTVAGMSGIGGGSLLAPVLILLFGVKAAVAVGTDLVYSVPMKALAALTHWRQGTVDRRTIGYLTLGGVPGAAAGLIAFANLRAHVGEAQLERILRHAIGVAILCAAASALVVMIVNHRRRDGAVARPAITVAIGAGVGFLVALTSIGSGSVTLPLLLLFLSGIPLRRLIGSEIVFAAVMIPVAAAGHVAFANVDWAMALSLTIGALPGAYLGAKLCTRVGEWTLRPAVIGLLTFAGFKLL